MRSLLRQIIWHVLLTLFTIGVWWVPDQLLPNGGFYVLIGMLYGFAVLAALLIGSLMFRFHENDL
jgi:hypothetical protein